MNNLSRSFLFIAIFSIPAYLIRFSIFGIPTNVLEILIYLTFIFFLLEKPTINWKELYKNYKTYIFSIALIFIGLILSTLINQNYREGFGIIKGWFFDPVLFSLVLINKIKGRKDIENVLKTLYFSAFTVSLVAFEYFFYGHLTYDGRLQSFYGSPNYLAMFLAPAAFIGLYILKINRQRAKIKDLVMIFSLFIIILIIYLTRSYAAWVSITASLIIVLFIENNFRKKFALISILIIFLVFLIQFSNPKFKDIFSERSSLSSRVMIWESATKIAEDNILFGIGPGNFQNKYLEYQKYFTPYLEWSAPQPHNLYLAFWLQSGILGIAGFLLLIYAWLRKLIGVIKQKNSQELLAAMLLGIMFSVLIHGLTDTPYWKNDLAAIFWIIFALGIIVNQSDTVFRQGDLQKTEYFHPKKETSWQHHNYL